MPLSSDIANGWKPEERGWMGGGWTGRESSPQNTLQIQEMLRSPTAHLKAQRIKNSRLERAFTTDHLLNLFIEQTRMMRFLGN